MNERHSTLFMVNYKRRSADNEKSLLKKIARHKSQGEGQNIISWIENAHLTENHDVERMWITSYKMKKLKN